MSCGAAAGSSSGGRQPPSSTLHFSEVEPVERRLALAKKVTGSSGKRPTLGFKQVRVARGRIAQNWIYTHCDDLASTRKPISTGLGADVCTQKSFIQRLRCRLEYALLVRRRLRSSRTRACRDLQRHESQNARVETRRLGLTVEFFALRGRAQEVETGFCVRRGRSQWT
jgi:hypothetical protein